mmetsp:Transcript_34810/g.103265  ORF Transcript_34810/g.103265 Transcript_34810/m.103265 type:complete len:102 (+) Transcript_34810:297-602(+)
MHLPRVAAVGLRILLVQREHHVEQHNSVSIVPPPAMKHLQRRQLRIIRRAPVPIEYGEICLAVVQHVRDASRTAGSKIAQPADMAVATSGYREAAPAPPSE